MKAGKILVYGYGNPGRQDDALGVLLVEIIEKWVTREAIKDITVDSNYQLNIEDSADMAEHDIVIFADASREEIDSYHFTKVKPSPKVEFSMHSVSPSFVLNLCKTVYGKTPETYLMHIKGYEWEFMEGVSQKALKNLDKAVEFIRNFIIETQKG